MTDTLENTEEAPPSMPTANGYPKVPLIEVALGEVIAERVRQEEKWGNDSILPVGIYDRDSGQANSQLWLKSLILQEEVGEVAKAILDREPAGDLYRELAQVAAVALAFMESILEDQIQMAVDVMGDAGEPEDDVR